MPFLDEDQVKLMGFASIGTNVKISADARFYFPHQIHLGDHCRVDDFVVISGKVKLGKYVHIAVHSDLSGGDFGIEMLDFSGCAFGVSIVAQTDDYSGKNMTNPTVPPSLTGATGKTVVVGKHAIIGAKSLLLPGASIGEGAAIGAMSMVRKPVTAWTINSGNPLRKIGMRSKNILDIQKHI
jgi:acetyltransferase-like isoleucine patch superfamily enzyme